MLITDKNSPSDIYHSIIKDDPELFHSLVAVVEGIIDLSNHTFRAIDLRAFDFSGKRFNLDGCYFRNTDLRGVDLSRTTINGASLHDARISGCWFPVGVDACEITMSNIHGTRIRVQ